jgi:hypothetical protein
MKTFARLIIEAIRWLKSVIKDARQLQEIQQERKYRL